MDLCAACGGPLGGSWCGRPRRWCVTCLPSINDVGKAEYQRRHKLLRAGRPVTGSPRPARVCAADGCVRAVVSRGLCASHVDLWRRYGPEAVAGV
jgi:hypothetical protein